MGKLMDNYVASDVRQFHVAGRPIEVPAYFYTDRLLLRPLGIRDAENLFQYCTSDSRVTRHLTWNPHQNVSEAIIHIEECHVRADQRSEFNWAVTIAQSGQFIGMVECGIQERSVSLGYLVGHAWWGNGYAAEAASAVLNWSETLDKIEFANAYCDTENTSSMRVLERLGFQRGGVLDEKVIFPGIALTPREAYWYWVKLPRQVGHNNGELRRHALHSIESNR
jgi:ribosomal-protein-alanine N-acetyltransferase